MSCFASSLSSSSFRTCLRWIDHDGMSLSARELSAITITERVCSAVSLLGTSIIVVTFLASRSFRKPINRLVFYASWGNLMTNIATLIAQSGIQAGTSSCLCRFQAFFIQWYCGVFFILFVYYGVALTRRIGSCRLMPCGRSAWPVMFI